jgi:hypothetical protein
MVKALLGQREKLLERDSVLSPSIPRWPVPGRLLLFDPDASLFDGAAEVTSQGFFDAANTPPWDTWVYYDTDPDRRYDDFFSTLLISWVPPAMVEFANEGISVNPEGCIRWAADVDVPHTRILRNKGFLG